MPWHISDTAPGCNGYAVVKDDTGEVVTCHKTKDDAEAHLKALYASEADKIDSSQTANVNPQQGAGTSMPALNGRKKKMRVQKAAKTYSPNDGMKSAARRALAWKEEGKRGGTIIGLTRANQIVNGTNLSESTVKRMYSFFSRHEVDKRATGFSSGEEGYPSPGRVAWDLWGGDAGFTWSRNIAEGLRKDLDMDKAGKSFSIGDMVSWDSSGGEASGKIEYIMREGTLGVPNTEFSIRAEEGDPAVLIRVYRDGEPTENLVGHKMSELRAGSTEKDSEGMGEEYELSGLNDRQEDQAEAYYEIVEEYGQFDQSAGPDGAHYAGGSDNPFKSEGLKCSSCIFFEENACHIVSGQIDPDGICKLWIIAEEGEMDDMEEEDEDEGMIEDTQKREYSTQQRNRMAYSGQAMEDGSYPIATEQDLRNAIQAFGRASDPEAVKRHIIRRARALGRTDLLPEGWNVKKAEFGPWGGSFLPNSS